jgi:hypothetical protein
MARPARVTATARPPSTHAGVGKAPTMPANPDLDAKPEVVAELVKLIRGLAN